MERLRDAAAQTLGLGSVLLEDEPFMSMKKEDEDDVQVGMIATAARRGRENLLHDAEEEDGYLDEGGVTPIGDADGLGLGLGGGGLLVPLTPTLATTPTQPLYTRSECGATGRLTHVMGTWSFHNSVRV